MKKIWFRVGMEAEITDELYDSLIKARNEYKHTDLLNLMEEIINSGELSGETYIVGKNNGGVEDYDNPDEEISVLF